MMDAKRYFWIDNLRSAITVMVVAHHSMLAYPVYAWFDKDAYIRSSHPVVDPNRWIGFDIIINFNDIFFMSLMFLIGGLFLVVSIRKKGAGAFIRDRFCRLFIPFLFLGTVFMLVAYYPAYYIAHIGEDINAYIRDFFVVEFWPSGPSWFIWVLFIFNLLFVLIYTWFPGFIGRISSWVSSLKNKPFAVFFLLFTIAWILYVPLAYTVGQGTWTGIGPFDFQISRIILYFGFFMIGVVIGSTDFNSEIFDMQSRLVRSWWLWSLLAVAVFTILTVFAGPLVRLINNFRISEFFGWVIYYTIYMASCTLSCLALLTIFRRWADKGKRSMRSLSGNAYLIYLVHYIFVIWSQFFLLSFEIPVIIKFLVTFGLSLSLSWITSVYIRKIKIAKRYL